MKVLLLILSFFIFSSIVNADVPNLINYQGRLTNDSGEVLDTTVSIVFTIYDDSIGGDVWWTENNPSVTTVGGLFNVLLGSINPVPDSTFDGPNRWLGVKVGDDPEILPRSRLISMPYSYRVSTVDGATGGTISGDVVIQNNLSISGKATIGPNMNAGTAAFVAGASNTANGEYSSVGGGFENEAIDYYAAVGGGYKNKAEGIRASVGGGGNNAANGNYSRICGGNDNQTSTYGGDFIGGGENNLAGSSINGYNVVVGGTLNRATGYLAFVGGGTNNYASARYGMVGGGILNKAGYNSTDTGDVVVGGRENQISNHSHYSFIGGGKNNHIVGNYSNILGGIADTITSNYSYLFGCGSRLSQDSTFMVDMPHIRFGDETDGYEFPETDGDTGQVLMTDGNGQLSWVTLPGVAYSFIEDTTLYINQYQFYNIASITIQIPSDGYLELEYSFLGENTPYLIGLGTQSTEGDIDTASFTSDENHYEWNRYLPISEGTHSYYLGLKTDSGEQNPRVRDISLSATFYPVNYGE